MYVSLVMSYFPMNKTEYLKLRTKIFGILDGLSIMDKRYFNVIKLMHYAETVHSGKRKDSTPEFSHQVEMLGLVMPFHDLLLKPYEVYMTIIAHDLIEDYPETYSVLQRDYPCIVDYSYKLSKADKDADLYFNNIANCEVCSIVKMIDRIHNLSTAIGVFSPEKLISYCTEVEEYFTPMIRTAKNQFNQRNVYVALKNILMIQHNTITKIILPKITKDE